MTFAEILSETTAHLGLTRQQLATQLGIPLRTAEHWLSGDRTPLALTQDAALIRLALAKTDRVMVVLTESGQLELYFEPG